MNIPNMLTVARVALIPVFIAFYTVGFDGWNYWAFGTFVLASLTDFFDGMLARKMNCVTNFGKFMDPIADKLLVTAALFMLIDWGRVDVITCSVLIGRDLIVTGVRLIGAEQGKVIAAGYVGKWKTLVQMVGIGCLLLGFPYIGEISVGLILIYASVVLAVWSCIEYIYVNREIFKAEK